MPTMPPWIRESYRPDRRSAVDHFRRVIDHAMLREIAQADYAQGVEQHLEALMPIWKEGELKELGTWFPMEVLELVRWSEPQASTESIRVREHRLRAFSCAVLLATPNFEPDKETLIQMLDSVFALGREAQKATARFLVWRINALERGEDRPFFALAVAAVIQSLEPALGIPNEQELADWIEEEEAAERAYLAGFRKCYRTCPWLFGLSFSDMRNKRWEALIRRMRKASGGRPLGRMLAKNHQG